MRCARAEGRLRDARQTRRSDLCSVYFRVHAWKRRMRRLCQGSVSVRVRRRVHAWCRWWLTRVGRRCWLVGRSAPEPAASAARSPSLFRRCSCRSAYRCRSGESWTHGCCPSCPVDEAGPAAARAAARGGGPAGWTLRASRGERARMAGRQEHEAARLPPLLEKMVASLRQRCVPCCS